MANLNTFIKNSTTEFCQSLLIEPITIPGTFLVKAGTLDPYKSEGLNLIGKLSNVKFVGGSRVDVTSVTNNLSRDSICISLGIPGVGSLTGDGKFALSHEELGKGKVKVSKSSAESRPWTLQFYPEKRSTSAIYLSINCKFGFLEDDTLLLSKVTANCRLGQGRLADWIQYKKGATYSAVLSMCNMEMEVQKARDIHRLFGEEIQKEFAPDIEDALQNAVAGLENHLQASLKRVGFFEIMGGQVNPPPLPLPEETAPRQFHQLPGANCHLQAEAENPSSSSKTDVVVQVVRDVPVSDIQEVAMAVGQRQGLNCSASDISETVLSSKITSTDEGVCLEIVTKKIIQLKYEA